MHCCGRDLKGFDEGLWSKDHDALTLPPSPRVQPPPPIQAPRPTPPQPVQPALPRKFLLRTIRPPATTLCGPSPNPSPDPTPAISSNPTSQSSCCATIRPPATTLSPPSPSLKPPSPQSTPAHPGYSALPLKFLLRTIMPPALAPVTTTVSCC